MFDALIHQIVATARISLESAADSTELRSRTRSIFIAGQPIKAILTIHTSFRWAGQEKIVDNSFRLRFNVEEMLKHWLISGQRQGEFNAEVLLILMSFG